MNLYNFAWILGMASVYLPLFAAPLVLGSWIVLQRSGIIATGLWLALLFFLLAGAVVIGAVGLYFLGATPYGSIRAA